MPDCKEAILSNEYYDVITDLPVNLDICYHNIDNLYNIVYLDRSDLVSINDYLFDYRSVPNLYGLMQNERNAGGGFDPNSLIVSGITQIQREPLSLTGNGTILCIIDTGIDYTNAAFRDENGNSRILAIWDQTIQTGEPPEGFQYGTEYTKEQIDSALRSQEPYRIVPSRDEIGHGSAMAGVAAGSRLGSGYEYLGAAPEAEIVVVKLKECKPYLREFYLVANGVPAYQENDIMLAIQYGDGFARTFRRPVIFCLGVGTNLGDHAGSSPLAKYLNLTAVKQSRAVIVGGGNEGNAAHHYQYQGRGNGQEQSGPVPVEVRVEEGAKGFMLELWGTVPDVFTVSVRSPGGETIPAVRLGIQDSITYRFVYESTRITIAGTLVEAGSGEELVLLRVENPTPGIWIFQVEAEGEVQRGGFNMWLPVTEFLNTQVSFLNPTPYITLTEPSMALEVISVSAYDAANNSFYVDSGRGFSRIDTIRPDFAAPGVNVSTIYGKQSGSALAAAMTAGAVSQFMQWAVVRGNQPEVSSSAIKNYFRRGAARSNDLTYPNREWGYGRLNLVGTFNALIGV